MYAIRSYYETSLAFTEDVATRFLAYGWHVERIEGENLHEIDAAVRRAKEDSRPSLIVARTHIAKGAPNKQDTPEAHGAPLGSSELALTKRAYGRNPADSFVVPPKVSRHMLQAIARGQKLERTWEARNNFV